MKNKFETIAIHTGNSPDPVTGSISPSIHLTSTFVQDGIGKNKGYDYSRGGNPTRARLEKNIAALEGGFDAIAFASGMAATTALFQGLQKGDHVIVSRNVYGGTYRMATQILKHHGLDFDFVDTRDSKNIENNINPNTKWVFIETPTNPMLEITEIQEVSKICKEHGIKLAVDNTFMSSFGQRPLEFGADCVMHSSTKFIGGHGNSIGGVVTESGRFNWGNGRFPEMTEPVATYNGLRYWENFGEYAFCTKLRSEQLRDLGASLAPMNAFLLIQGLETLPFRMDGHVANAKTVASFLQSHSEVSWVNYAGLESSPHYELANKYMPKGPGAIFTFGVKGGREAGAKFIDSLQLISHLANVGDVRSLVIHPASTTHQQLSDEDLASGGVSADMVRLSVGLEDSDDILWDLDQALEKASS